MGDAPKPSAKRERLGRAERAAAQQRHAAQQQPLPDYTIQVDGPEALLAANQTAACYGLGVALRAVLKGRDDGVLKICPTDNPMLCYSYWRWSRGNWAGHYVCSLSTIYELAKGLANLQQQIAFVEAGIKRPTHDKY